MKKFDLPWMKWFWGDWFKCPEIRALSPATRCAWFEMLGLMWESTERGYLTLNGKPYPIDCLARCLGFAQANLEQSISEMESFNVFSRRPDGAIYNRRMVADTELSEKRAIAGKMGGICSSKKQANTQAKSKQPLNLNLTSESDSSLLSGSPLRQNTKKEKRAFMQPSIEEVRQYCKDRKNNISPEKWFSHYEANGWKVGRNSMKDWRAAVRTWERTEQPQTQDAFPHY